MLFDYRCPRCDRAVDGADINTSEVRIYKAVPKVLPTQCVHCKTLIILVGPVDDGLGEEYYFDVSKSPATEVHHGSDSTDDAH